MQTALSVDKAGLDLYELTVLLMESQSDAGDVLSSNTVGNQFNIQKSLLQIKK